MSEQKGVTAPWGSGQLVYKPASSPRPYSLGIVVTGLAPRVIAEHFGEPLDQRYVTIVTFSGLTYTNLQSAHEKAGWEPAPIEFEVDWPVNWPIDESDQEWRSEEPEEEEEDTTFVDALSADLDELEVRVEDAEAVIEDLVMRVERFEKDAAPARLVLHHVRQPGPSPYSLNTRK